MHEFGAFLLELRVDINFTIVRLIETKKKHSQGFKKFCSYLLKFLEDSEKKGDYRTLQMQIPRILNVINISLKN